MSTILGFFTTLAEGPMPVGRPLLALKRKVSEMSIRDIWDQLLELIG